MEALSPVQNRPERRPPRGGTLAALTFVALVLLTAHSASAQMVRGVVRDSLSGRPVSGAVLQALDGAGRDIARTISGATGRFAFTVPPSATTLRVVRIGFRPARVPVSPSSAAPVEIAVVRLETLLQPVAVDANSACRPRADRATAHALFEQVKTALLATVVARDASPAIMKRLRFQRYLEGRTDRITSQDVTVDSVSSQFRPFQSVRSAAEFVRQGYVADTGKLRKYFAPDADVLIDPVFARTYCLRLADADRKRPNEVGVAFDRGSARRTVVDVEGTIWVDTTARVLRAIDYRYTGVSGRERPYEPGGRIEFREMPNGSLLIDRWMVRVVAFHVETVTGADGRSLPRIWYEIQESGGELASARWADGSTWEASLGTLRVEARTREGTPAAGRVLNLQYTNYGGAVDPTGELEITDLLPGPYRMQAFDSTLAVIDIVLETPLRIDAVRDSVIMRTLTVPTALDYAVDRCGPEPNGGSITRPNHLTRSTMHVPRMSNGSISFFVYATRPDGTPVPNLFITEQVLPKGATPEFHSEVFSGRTDHGGRYFSCWNFVLGETVQVWVKPEGKAPQVTVQKMTAKVNAIRIIVR